LWVEPEGVTDSMRQAGPGEEAGRRRVPAIRAQRAPGDPPSVLLVEDDRLQAMAVEDALGLAGYRVAGVAGTEAEARRLAATLSPDFAVLDISLGASNAGLAIGRLLAERGTVVLYASAHGIGHRQEMEDAGGRACLLKPFAPEDVPRALGILESYRLGEAPCALPPSFHLFVD
jgi:CheY-like chemotaxis protein